MGALHHSYHRFVCTLRVRCWLLQYTSSWSTQVHAAFYQQKQWASWSWSRRYQITIELAPSDRPQQHNYLRHHRVKSKWSPPSNYLRKVIKFLRYGRWSRRIGSVGSEGNFLLQRYQIVHQPIELCGVGLIDCRGQRRHEGSHVRRLYYRLNHHKSIKRHLLSQDRQKDFQVQQNLEQKAAQL